MLDRFIKLALLSSCFSGCGFYGVPEPNVTDYSVEGILLSRSRMVLISASNANFCAVFKTEIEEEVVPNCAIKKKSTDGWQEVASGFCFYNLEVHERSDVIALICNKDGGETQPCISDNRQVVSIETTQRLSGYESEIKDEQGGIKQIQFKESCEEN